MGFDFNITNDLNNAGILTLNEASPAGGEVDIVMVGGTTLINSFSGTVRSAGTDTSRSITGNFINDGVLDVDYSLTLNVGGAVFALNGEVDVANNQTLTIDGGAGGTFDVTEGRDILGLGSIDLEGSLVVNLMDRVELSSGLQLSTPGAVQFTTTATDRFENQGIVDIIGDDDVFDVEVVNEAGATLNVVGGAGVDGVGTFNNDLTNDGDIVLDSTGGFAANIAVAGIFTHNGGGEIQVEGTGSRTISADVTGNGDLTVNADLTVAGDLVLNGVIDASENLTADGDVTLGGTTRIAAGRSLTMSSAANFINTGLLTGTGLYNLSAAAMVINDGIITPGFVSTDNLTIDAVNLDFGAVSILGIEVNTAADHPPPPYR